MSKTIKEIMNPELFGVRPADSVREAREGLLAMGVSSAPVLDGGGRPIGLVSLHQLVSGRDDEAALERMTVPAWTLREDARIAEAARLIAERDHVHVVVVDEENRAVGMVSAVDVLRALLGEPARHPEAFPHLDAETGLHWTDDGPLDEAHAEASPDAPGLIVLVHDRPGSPRRTVWAESAVDMQARLLDILDLPQESPELGRWLEHRSALRFRTASVPSEEERTKVLQKLRGDIRKVSSPIRSSID